MYSDIDIKIAGDKPSKDINRNSLRAESQKNIDKVQVNNARSWGKAVALNFIKNANEAVSDGT